MKRRLFNWFAWLSLLLAVASVALWVRSCFANDQLSRKDVFSDRQETTDQTILSSHGWLLAGYSVIRLPNAAPLPWEPTNGWVRNSSLPSAFTPAISGKAPWLFRYGERGDPNKLYSRQAWDVGVKYWLIVAVLLIAPATRLFFALKRMPATGHCKVCGYDLRGTPDRCPECGSLAHKETAGTTGG